MPYVLMYGSREMESPVAAKTLCKMVCLGGWLDKSLLKRPPSADMSEDRYRPSASLSMYNKVTVVIYQNWPPAHSFSRADPNNLQGRFQQQLLLLIL